MNRLYKNNGVSIVIAIIIILIVSILGTVMVSMLGTTSRGVVDYQRSAQALGIAQGGLNWYMMRLCGMNNWTSSAVNQTGVIFGAGSFDLTVSNKTSPFTDSAAATRLDIAVTGKVAGSGGAVIQRTMSQRAWKLPSATKFALFWGRNVADLSFNSVAINGDFWSQGTTSIPGDSSVTNGSAYRSSTEDITGAGTYTEVDIGAFPYFSNFSGSTATHSTPAFDSSYYTALTADYDDREADCTTNVDISQNTDRALAGDILCCRDFNTNGNITISGHGYIVANRDILLHNTNGDSGTLVFSPSGGEIVFIAGRDIIINSNQADTPVTMNSGVRMYSKSDSSNAGQITIRNNTTNIDGALILAARRIIVQDSANITGSTLFVNDPGNATNNVLNIIDSGTSVGTIEAPCNVISIGRGTPTLQITDTASVTGLVYQRDANNLGRTNIDGSSNANRVNIRGSLIVNAFAGNDIDNANIIYDPTAIPDPPPEGFNGFATKKPDSWRGN